MITDFHNHLVPGVDDGSATLDESRAALGAMRAQGMSTVITTPHLSCSTFGQPAELADYLARVDVAWAALAEVARTEFLDMRLERGFELRLDAARPDLADPRLRLAGTRFVLVELPWGAIPPDIGATLLGIRSEGYMPIIAHPERYRETDEELRLAGEWRGAGAYLQVNHGSVTGQYGDRAQRIAWALLRRGWVDYLSSDYHANGDCHAATSVLALERAGAGAQAEALTVINPGLLVSGSGPRPVAPLDSKGANGAS